MNLTKNNRYLYWTIHRILRMSVHKDVDVEDAVHMVVGESVPWSLLNGHFTLSMRG